MTVATITKRVVLVLMSTVFSLVAAEALLRFGVIPNPQYSRVQVRETPRKGAWKILILGDSFMVPRGRLGRELDSRLGRRDVAVVNAATSGTGPYEYLATARRELAGSEADLVLLGYYVGNDLTDVQHHPLNDSGLGAPGRSPLGIDTTATRPVLRNLYLYHFLRAKLLPIRIRFWDYDAFVEAGVSPELVEDAKAFRINPFLVRLGATRQSHLLDNLLIEKKGNDTAWIETQRLIAEAQELSTRRGAKFLMVAFPSTLQVSRSHFEFFRKLGFHTDERTLTSDEPQRRLKELALGMGTPLLDLLAVFRNHRELELYLEKDDHLNETGGRLAADHIVDFVVSELLGPRSLNSRESP